MTASKRLDLDAALAERKQADEPLVVTLFDQDWELPGTVPAMVTIRIADWYENGLVDEDGEPVEGTTLSGAQCMLLLRDMVPPAVLAQWADHGLGTDDYIDITDNLMRAYRDQLTSKSRAEGKATARPNRASRRSSGAGGSSKRTSRASTRSTTSSRS